LLLFSKGLLLAQVPENLPSFLMRIFIAMPVTPRERIIIDVMIISIIFYII